MKNFSLKLPSAISSLSLRNRLILGNVIITFLAVAALGIYIYYRAQADNAFLTDQLNKSILQQANSQLTTTSSAEADALNDFFASLDKDVTNLGATTSRLLSQEAIFSNSNYWNATQSLSHLSNGSWDNSNSDVASIFIPGRIELTDPLTAELNTIKQLDFVAPTYLKSNPDIIAVYFGGISGETLYYPNIDLASLVPANFDVTQRPWFLEASPSLDPSHQAVWSDPYLDAAHNGLVVTVSIPIYDASGSFRGVVAMDIQLKRISDIIANIKVGQSGYALLLDRDKRLIALPPSGYRDLGTTPDSAPLGSVLAQAQMSNQAPAEFWTILNSMSAGKSAVETIQLNNTQRFVAYSPVPEVRYSLLIVEPSAELLAGSVEAQQQLAESTRSTLILGVFLVIGILAVSLLATLVISGALTSPLKALTETAEEITAGNLEATAEIKSQDEIGTLANALNTMTSTLRETIQSLEQRVKERTSALEEASHNADRRARQFEALSRATRAMSSIRNINELLPLVTSVISEFFDYYHAGIFLNDENNEFTYLTAANSEGGQRMLERNHNLKIGLQGIVGYVAAANEIRIAHKVGQDDVFFDNPDLPGTKSEAALPLRRGDRVIGVLDLQSTKEYAFSQEDINVLTILADQVSLAIENARSFETTQRSLTEAETLYRQYLRQAWSRLPREQRVAGFRYTSRGTSLLETPVDSNATTETETGKSNRVMVPIKLRGETIGNLSIQAPQDTELSHDQMDLIQAVAERIALSAENARLFDETSRRAERERMVTEITSKIRSTNDPESMIKIALNELRNALGATQVQLIPQAITTPQDSERKIFTSTPDQSAETTPSGNGVKP